jgi:cytochrome b pre-mRNA-processing protein 3
MLKRLWASFLGRDLALEKARDLYSDIVVQARDPYFYEDLQVPDTVEGRFDMITLHMFLVLKRLKDDAAADHEFAQKLFDTMFKNMDDSLREMGVGDLVVGKRVRKLAEDFYGRVGIYEEVFEQPEELAKAMGRNILGDENAAHGASLARYSKAQFNILKNEKLERFKSGIASFAVPQKLIAA